MRRPSALGSETRLHEPVVQAEQVHRDRAGRRMAGHERVANEREHSTAKNAQPSTVAYCARRPNTRGPVTRRARCRAGSERVQRDRVEQFGLGHAWVANESRSNPNPGAWFACSVLEVNSEIGDGAFRDLGRGAMLYILRAGSMTGILTRTHGTGPDTSTVQFRPSCKCVINSGPAVAATHLAAGGPRRRLLRLARRKTRREWKGSRSYPEQPLRGASRWSRQLVERRAAACQGGHESHRRHRRCEGGAPAARR